jgi:hypothetical protein
VFPYIVRDDTVARALVAVFNPLAHAISKRRNPIAGSKPRRLQVRADLSEEGQREGDDPL